MMIHSLYGIRRVLDELAIAADHEMDYLQIEDAVGNIFLITEDPDNDGRFVFGVYDDEDRALAGDYVDMFYNLIPLQVVGYVNEYFIAG